MRLCANGQQMAISKDCITQISSWAQKNRNRLFINDCDFFLTDLHNICTTLQSVQKIFKFDIVLEEN